LEKMLIAQLMDMPSHQWARAIERHRVFAEYCSIARPNAEDVERCGQKLGLKRRGFYRLLRIFKDQSSDTYRRAVSTKAGSMLAADVERLIVAAIDQQGASARLSGVIEKVRALCTAANVTAPSVSAIRARFGRAPKASKLHAQIPVLNDWLLDSCVLRLSVQSSDGRIGAAKLTAVFDVRTGRVIAHQLTNADESPSELLSHLVGEAKNQCHSSAVRTVGISAPDFQILSRGEIPQGGFRFCALGEMHSGIGFSSVLET